MYSQVVVVRNPSGLHARPASEFVAKAKSFQSKISISAPQENEKYSRSGDEAEPKNAKSIIILLTLGVGQGEAVELQADGPDAQQAVDALAALIEGGFGEI